MCGLETLLGEAVGTGLPAFTSSSNWRTYGRRNGH